MFYLVGLGNPGVEYQKTRHNVGREIVEKFAKQFNFSVFKFDKKIDALVAEGKIKKEKVLAILPETFMNKSGNSLKKIISSKSKAKNLIVVHDDLDLPVGRAKIVFGKNSGGHRGIESVMRAIKTKDFIRIKIGNSGKTASGKIKKPKGEDLIVKHVLSKFSPKDEKEIKKVQKKTLEAIEKIITIDYLQAMNGFN